MTSAAARADMPARMCTTVPPAKSSAPNSLSQPPTPHTQCAAGAYTTVAQITRKISRLEKRMRSAKAPMISAGVMPANLSWKKYTSSAGMVAE
jgi:hypothetical protein